MSANTAANAAYQTPSLYVGDLKDEVNETTLYEVFKTAGTIASIRVCRDSVTRRSLHYAYVNYHNIQDAERALDTLNYTAIMGKACRVMRSIRDPSARKSSAANIYIKNLEKGINHQQLLDTFSAFGNVLSCKVETDDEGNSKGFGYVHFEKEEDAKKAIEQANGKLVNGKAIFVGPFLSRRERVNTVSEQKYTNVFVKNMIPNVTKEALDAAFSKYGKITSSVVKTKELGHSGKDTVTLAYAFVNFETHENAVTAVAEMNDKVIPELTGEKKLFVARAQKRSERDRELKAQFEKLKAENSAKHSGVNLYVRNLDDTITDEELRTIFASFGTIASAKVMRDDKGASRGFGFVSFASSEEATKAISEMNGSLVHQKPLYVAIAQKKEQRQELLRLHRQRQAMMGMYSPYMQFPYYPQMPQRMMGMGMGFPANMPLRYPQMPQGQRRGPYPQGQQGQQQMMGQQMAPQGARMARSAAPQGQRPQGRMMPGAPQAAVQQPRAVQQQPRTQQPRAAPAATPAAAAPAPAAAAPVEQAVDQSMGSLSAEEFQKLSASVGELKQTLGERLYGHVFNSYSQEQKCGKITGMLLESLEMAELNTLLGNPEALKTKIDEASNVYEEHQRQHAEAPAS